MLYVSLKRAEDGAANWRNVKPFTACPDETELRPIGKSWWEFLYCQWEITMKNAFLLAVMAATLASTAAQAAELPGYELKGFPITRHQVAVMGAANVQERSLVPTLMFGGMPASPSQITILTPRAGTTLVTIAAKPTTVGLVSK